jgi:murein DD-endopeptidase MepM/ murein hydrolase activator NlpD
MKRIVLVLLVALAATAGVARGDVRTFQVVGETSTLPSADYPNGAELVLAPSWMTPPAEPAQLSYDQLLGVWQQAGQVYAVPWNVLAAINKIESNFGRNMGPSSAGAIGWMQFMPSTWVRWGTDGDGNGAADPWNPVDAIYSAARYLAASGAATDIRQAVFSYNHAWWYVDDVVELAQLYGGSDSALSDEQAVFALDQLQAQLEDAQAAVIKASDAFNQALAQAQVLTTQEQALTDEADAKPLLSDRLDAEKVAAQQGAEAAAAQAETDRLRSELEAAQAKLAELQGQAQAASFNQPAGQILAAPSTGAGSYVFPVGGGAAAVSVSRYHHDYPAADIAAPDGAPLYALSNGTVLYAWNWDERCGIGFTMQATDGQIWTYCHLSYLYPSVTQGAELTGGDPVGLVGSTGNSTGPHLHLQLQPSTRYPQGEDWFQSFAETAYHWSDDWPTKAGAPAQGLVFHIVGPAG